MLRKARIENFRCIRAADLEFDASGTGVIGPNAAGKTTLLEALFFLANARSFRTATRDTLVGPSDSYLRVVAELVLPTGPMTAGIEYSSGSSRIRVGGEDARSVSEVSAVLPIQVIDPGIHRLIEEGSARRRRQVDWGVFHVEPAFLNSWRRYNRALQQRNAALRAGHDWRAIAAWDPELLAAGQAVDELRGRYMSSFAEVFQVTSGALLEQEVRAEYRRGWPQEFTLEASLERCRERDRRLRTTTTGPHRADIVFRWSSGVARDRISRGQQKLLAAAFVLAQTRLRALRTQSTSTLLLDDPAAELDVDNLGKLLQLVRQTPAQLVVTSLTRAGLEGIQIGRMFHVEQGRFTSVL